MKKVATTEHKAYRSIPEIVGITVVAVEVPLTVIVTPHVEEFAVAARVDYVQSVIHATTL